MISVRFRDVTYRPIITAYPGRLVARLARLLGPEEGLTIVPAMIMAATRNPPRGMRRLGVIRPWSFEPVAFYMAEIGLDIRLEGT